jgi:acetoin utilization deacetylase AcuC-like enzyme
VFGSNAIHGSKPDRVGSFFKVDFMHTTAFLDHPDFLKHRTGPSHPDRPIRLEVVRQAVAQAPWRDRLRYLDPRLAEREELLRVHTPEYLDYVREQSASHQFFLAGSDTPGSAGTWTAACRAAGAVLTAIDAVVAGTVNNAFCAVRPPGHHAGVAVARGFCFLNNVAIGVRHFQVRHGLRRIAILDWDAHHANGTQDIFEADGEVLLCGTHEFPLYPGSGRECERGCGSGLGRILNRPLARGSTDVDLRAVFENEFRPALRDFRPDAILISAGFDGLAGDPLANLKFTPTGFRDLTRRVRAWADELCGGRIVSVLEGGYVPEDLAAGVCAHLEALSE